MPDDGVEFARDEGFRKVEVVGFRQSFQNGVFIRLVDIALERLFHFTAQFVLDLLQRRKRAAILGKLVVESGQRFLFDAFNRQ